MRSCTVSIDAETYERFTMYSKITEKSIRSTVIEALNFWMDTAGAAEIEIETGVDVAPQQNTDSVSIPPQNVTPINALTQSVILPPLPSLPVGHC